VATILLYLYVPVCLEFFSWKTVFFTASALAVLAILVFAVALSFIVLNSGAHSKKTNSDGNVQNIGYFSLIKKAGIIEIFIAIIMMGILRDGIESWLPTLYSEAFNRDASESILVSVSLPIFSIISITVITALHKNKLFNNEVLGSAILFLGVVILALPIVFMIKSESAVIRIICLVLSALVCGCMHGVNFLLISCLPGRFSTYGKAATTSGLCNAFVYVGAAISMYGFALISELFDWQATVISWILVAALGIAFTVISLKAYTKFIKSENS
jgi:OPA family glycerol-3-phosphate transporter-like MFS transporter